MKYVIDILKGNPLTGKDLIQQCSHRPLEVWRFCQTNPEVSTQILGQRYLRLDKKVEGYARLSPSILREFLTYTVIGLKQEKKLMENRAEDLMKHIRGISESKLELARSIMAQIVSSYSKPEVIKNQMTAIIAGDVIYNMAHSENRPEFSTGAIIRGSDLDIIIITSSLAPALVKELDQIIYGLKYHLIKNPAYQEEIDYIIKDIGKVEQQLSFNRFEFMVASKILAEGKYLSGSKTLFNKVKTMVSSKGIPTRLKELETVATLERTRAKNRLIDASKAISEQECNRLFFTTEEADEIY